MDNQVSETLEAMALLVGRTLSPQAVDMLERDLSVYPTPAVLRALERCRKELRGFPSLAEIIERIDDGRPGVEEAWAMLPKDESVSVVWTDEMSEAFNVIRPLLAQDSVAARMSFKEVYTRLLAEARSNLKPARWSVSLGLNPAGRDAVLKQALAKGRLSHEQVSALLPAPPPTEALQIEGPAEGFTEVKDILAEIKKKIAKGA